MKYINVFIIIFLLSGCKTKTTEKLPSIQLPEFPLISIDTNKELKSAFNPVCTKTNILIADLKKDIVVYKQNETENKEKINVLEDSISELNVICSPKSRYTKEWLDEIYYFKIKYYIYKEGLKLGNYILSYPYLKNPLLAIVKNSDKLTTFFRHPVA